MVGIGELVQGEKNNMDDKSYEEIEEELQEEQEKADREVDDYLLQIILNKNENK